MTTQPRSVFCVIDALYRDTDRANDVALGIFDIAGQKLDLSTTPTWIDNPAFPADDEWRIEFSKFAYGLDLAHAYSTEFDRRHLDSWRDLVFSWIDQVSADHDVTDVVARRLQHWTYAWARFSQARGPHDIFSNEETERVLSSMAEQLAYVRANLAAERNHRTLELYSLLITGLAFPSLDQNGELVRFAAFELYRNLQSDVLTDGVHRERSTHYHAIALRSFLGTAINAKQFGLELRADYDLRLAQAARFLAHALRPDGSLPKLSDSDDGDYRELLGLAGVFLRVPELEYVATGGARGIRPTECNASFDLGGYHIQRSGWGDEATPFELERQLIFDCGAVGDSGHGHYDALHVEISAGGRALLSDPGRFTYDEAEHHQVNWRHHFKGTAAHNTVTVDGLDQIAYRRGKPKGPVSQARLLSHRSGDRVDELVGEVISPEYDAIHRRRILFVDRRWWLIEDELDAFDTHEYQLRWHLDDGAEGATALGPEQAVSAPGLRLFFPYERCVGVEQGWVSPSYGVRCPAPIITANRRGRTCRFVTVVVPADRDDPVSIETAGVSRLTLHRGERSETLDWTSNDVEWSAP